MDAIQFHSPNFSKRKHGVINCIVIHDTGGHNAQGAVVWFSKKESQVSAHYVIDRDGTLYECVEEEDKAWHAGVSSLHGVDNVNEFSIGIELVDNNDKDKYPDEQISTLLKLTTDLCVKYSIPLNRIVGHCHVAPGRKVDPGPDFPWFEFLASVGSNLIEKAVNGGDGD